jgi:hypothetical protein
MTRDLQNARPVTRQRIGWNRRRAKELKRRLTWNAALVLSGNVDLVMLSLRLQRLSRRCFNGWLTHHPPRWWEYPWTLREVRRRCQRFGLAADFGAGTSPLPIALADLGLTVNVVDPDAKTLLGRRWGNEWDFTDYERWGIRTYKRGIEDEIFESRALSVAVSVSVIEHIPAATRREGLRRVAEALEDGGIFVMTVDVLPGTDYLWNRVLDEIEPVATHGTINDLIREAHFEGLQLVRDARCPIATSDQAVRGLVFVRRSRS